MRLKIAHSTKYTYEQPLSYGLQQVRLTPVSSAHQTVHDWQVKITGGTTELSFRDQYQNETLLVQADPNVLSVSVDVQGEVETKNSDGIFGKSYGKAPLWHFLQSTPRTAPGPGTRKLSQRMLGKSDDLGDLHRLSAEILTACPYGAVKTTAETTAEDAFAAGGGVCQDHAQIFITAARLAGFPARYISGYLMMNDRVDQDASHAWAEVHLNDLGWVGFDVSNGISPDERYVRIATGRDSHDAAPITGLRLGKGNESMIVSLQIQQ